MITKVCIDDFAFKKRHTYGTIMIDIDTHRVIDLLDSREIDDVVQWLKTYPNLQVVSRDGSVSYASAIRQANPDIMQISDRFHLIKGLTDAVKKCITKLVSANFRIPASVSHYDGALTSSYWEKASNDDFPTKEHYASVEKKMKLVKQVHELRAKGYSKQSIAKELGITGKTVTNYLKPDFTPESGYYNSKRSSKIKPFENDIKAMLIKGYIFKKIEEEIRKKGYNGAASTIRMYATRERKLMKASNEKEKGQTELIERKWLISLLYKPLDKVKGITEEQVERVIQKHPVIGHIYDIVQSFKETLFAKKSYDLIKWIDEIDSFIGGITRDVDAVKNAIENNYNNGLAEGSVNKLKVVKRIMYGRNSFELLNGKLLRHELKRKFN